MTRILLTAPTAMRELYYGDEALAGLQALGEVRLNPGDHPFALNALIEAARDVDIIVSDRQTAGPAALFEALPQLRAFVRCAVDIRNVDVSAAAKNGTMVTHASPGFIDSVAELVIGYMIDLARQITASAIDYRAGVQPPVRMGRQLAGSHVGIIGFGAIGQRLAERCAALGMGILVNDPFVDTLPESYERCQLHDLLHRADFSICLAVANDRTEKLIDRAAFAAMRPDGYFINVARGNLVDEDALLATLNAGGMAGCAMDVGRASDQMPSPALASHPRVIATPHIGGLTPQAIRHQAMETVIQCQNIIQGRIPEGTLSFK